MRYCIGVPGSSRPIHRLPVFSEAGSKSKNHGPAQEFAAFDGMCDRVAEKPSSSSKGSSNPNKDLLKELAKKIEILEARLLPGLRVAPALDFVISDALCALKEAKEVRDRLCAKDGALAEDALRDGSGKKPELALLIVNITLHRLDDFSASKDKDE